MITHVKAAAVVLTAAVPVAAAAQPAAPAMEVVIVQPAAPADTILVERDTMVRLMVVNEVSTKVARAGDRFVLRVDEDVVVNGVTVIPVGAKAWGEVLGAETSGAVGKSGKLNARLLYVELKGDHIPLRGQSNSAGASGTGETIMGVIGLGPLGLLAHGNNAKLKAGEIFNGYFEQDMLFDRTTSRLVAKPFPFEGTPLTVSVAR